MENKTIKASTVDFVVKHISADALSAFFPIDADTVYDLIHEIEFSVEAPLVQDQEEGQAVDISVLDGCRDAIDDLNRDPDLVDFAHLNEELRRFLSK